MSTWKLSCLAVLGKANNPLYLRTFVDDGNELRYHYLNHTACDVIEERTTPPAPAATGGHAAAAAAQLAAAKWAAATDLYLGLLFTTADVAVYGYMTNTRIKFILTLHAGDAVVREADVRAVFARVHLAYCQLVCNPFYDPESQRLIASPRFNQAMAALGGEQRKPQTA
ncbi:hypothetical protein CXG81DRAFT_25670 [Caulochytrium protostelioides]|uniref:Trafficking protein particle complex subunit 2-like protein n=1 Tax=Caulochytrium protostelioides TaxID=1555241 RepID=A0A4P9X8P4_9FUNG|nr:hypothetical protein CXG81DRAFT_25670 [Caulochytrium protostelioides]|eukprot:RKP01635.1 hypothetical protein CXG81DRAFT_25670 [Caulochytrium protostelioides]